MYVDAMPYSRPRHHSELQQTSPFEDVVSRPERVGDDRESGRRPSRGRHERAVGDVEVAQPVRAAERIEHRRARVAAGATRPMDEVRRRAADVGGDAFGGADVLVDLESAIGEETPGPAVMRREIEMDL